MDTNQTTQTPSTPAEKSVQPDPDAPRVYVGTYGKYNSGSIEGKWLDLEDYSDKDEFLEACAELHKDEHDPEFMFQDYKNIPEGMISESHIESETWDWLNLDDDDKELLAVYKSLGFGGDESIKSARDAFYGRYDDEEDFAYQYVEDTGMLHDVPDNVKNYFDYEAFGRDLLMDFSTVEHNGQTWVFTHH
jgi:antirestriction protein